MTVRLLFAAALLVALAPSLSAQPDTATKYWIFFADKPAEASARFDRSSADRGVAISARAAARRSARGSQSRTERLDAPVPADYLHRLDALGVDIAITSRWFNAVSAPLADDQLAAVRALPFVREVRPVGVIVTEHAPPLSPMVVDYGPSALQLEQINAHAALEAGYDGTGVIVGFLDTTFDFEHPAFATTEVLDVQNFTGQEQSNTHGLSVASVAVGFDAGDLVGPAHGASVLAATTEFAPTETHQEEDFFVAGLEWLEASGADVVNVSLGYSTFDAGEGDYTYADLDGNTTLVTRAADLAASLGVAIVTSAGNEGNSDWFYITAPADADSVIAVGAVRADSSRAGFSSHGPTADGRIKPDVAALGVSVAIASASGGYTSGAGTSFSAPLVSGVVAQILQSNPALDPIAVRSLLRSTASQSDAPDNDRGWGIVNALAAIEEALAAADSGSAPAPPAELQVYPTILPRGRHSVTVEMPDTEASVRIALYDVLGRRVAVLHDGPARRGPAALALPSLPSGLYFYQATGGLDAGGRLVVQ